MSADRMREALTTHVHRDDCPCPICSSCETVLFAEGEIERLVRALDEDENPARYCGELDTDALVAIRDQLPLPLGVADVLTASGTVRRRYIPRELLGLRF